MSYRREGKSEHHEQNAWNAWKGTHAELLRACGLPPGVLRSRDDWNYLLSHGYWCEGPYGEHVPEIDFSLEELTPAQTIAFRSLLEKTLCEHEKQLGCAAWHHVNPPS